LSIFYYPGTVTFYYGPGSTTYYVYSVAYGNCKTPVDLVNTSYSYRSSSYSYNTSVDGTNKYGNHYGGLKRPMAGGVYNNTASNNGTRSAYCNANIVSTSAQWTTRGCN